jgi:hypothetical protein
MLYEHLMGSEGTDVRTYYFVLQNSTTESYRVYVKPSIYSDLKESMALPPTQLGGSIPGSAAGQRSTITHRKPTLPSRPPLTMSLPAAKSGLSCRHSSPVLLNKWSSRNKRSLFWLICLRNMGCSTLPFLSS